ncbi:MAG: hypothetical protein OXF06_07425 [Bacteroidetes bacterium]|nr:hypothetical protein [Bacteroidota bacterium]MCY4224652.1 hypothetical protein [Bacteroidota bacterium]
MSGSIRTPCKWQPIDRLNDLPSALCTDVELDSGLEIHSRHLEKKQRDADWIAMVIFPMSQTEKNIDAECIESVQAGLDVFVHALEERLHDFSHQKAAG